MRFIFSTIAVIIILHTSVYAQVLTSYLDREPLRDITLIFVHGLTSDARGSWKHETTGVYWPNIVKDDVELNKFNIAVIDYQSYFFGQQRIERVAQNSSKSILLNIPRGQKLVFVAHSLGGIIVREILLQSPVIAGRTIGIVTFATPMGGSRLADVAMNFGVTGDIIRQLEYSQDSNYVTRLLRRWSAAQKKSRIPIHCSAEGKRTGSFLNFEGALVVEQVSAFTGCDHSYKDWPDLDHSTINKPENEADPLHVWLKGVLLSF